MNNGDEVGQALAVIAMFLAVLALFLRQLGL